MQGKNTNVSELCHIHLNKRISWTAILVGAFTALGLGFLLNLLGIAIGLSVFKVMSNGAIILAIGGMLAILSGIVISMIIAGYAAGYLGRLYCPERNLGIIYGFTTWVSALIIGAGLIGLFSQYVATYTNTVARTVVAVPINQVTTPAGTTSISSSIKKGDKAEVEISVTQENLATGAFILFAMFFGGALFTCIGASWGMRCKRDDSVDDLENNA